jgi:hypothetical protein
MNGFFQVIVLTPHLKQFDIKNLELESFITIEDIKVEFEGRTRKMALIVITSKNLFYKYPTLKDPVICHNKNKRLTCYNDGTYKVDIIKNRVNSIIFFTIKCFIF